MRRASLFLTTLVLAALLLAACGGQQTSTSVPNTDVPPVTMEATGTSIATEAPTEASAGANTTSTPVIPVTGRGTPSLAVTTLIGSSVCGMAGEPLGTVQDLVLDFDQKVITYAIVDANGRPVAVPYSFLAEPRRSATGTGTGTGTGTQAADTPSAGGTLATNTPSSGGTGALATATPSAGGAVSTSTSTTGTGTGSGTGASGQQNCMTLTLGTDLFNKAPVFDPSIMPGLGQPATDWDTDIMANWVGGEEATATPEPTSTPAPSSTTSTSTPSASGTTSATATATTSSSSSSSGTEESSSQGVQQISGVALLSELLGASVSVNAQDSGTGTGPGSSTSTPSSGMGSETSTPSSGTDSGAGTGSSLGTGSQGTVEDVIVDARIGKLQYLVVSLGSDDAWIAVPISVVGWDATNNQIVLMVDASMLQSAPGFPSSQLPDTSAPGWDQEITTYWSGGGTGTGSGSGSGGTSSATATATP